MRSSVAFLVAALASAAFAAPLPSQSPMTVTLKNGIKAQLSTGKPANIKAAVGDFQCPDGTALVRSSAAPSTLTWTDLRHSDRPRALDQHPAVPRRTQQLGCYGAWDPHLEQRQWCVAFESRLR